MPNLKMGRGRENVLLTRGNCNLQEKSPKSVNWIDDLKTVVESWYKTYYLEMVYDIRN